MQQRKREKQERGEEVYTIHTYIFTIILIHFLSVSVVVVYLFIINIVIIFNLYSFKICHNTLLGKNNN